MAATSSSVGRLSEKSRLLTGLPGLAMLSMVKLSVVTPPTSIGSVAKALENSGALSEFTVSIALAGPELPKFEVRSPVVLVTMPDAAAIMSTEISQVLRALTTPPVRMMAVFPAPALRVPPQLLVALGNGATFSSAGSMLVKARLVIGLPMPRLLGGGVRSAMV